MHKKTHVSFHEKWLLKRSCLRENLHGSTNTGTLPNTESWKHVQQYSSCCMHTERWTDNTVLL